MLDFMHILKLFFDPLLSLTSYDYDHQVASLLCIHDCKQAQLCDKWSYKAEILHIY